MSLRRPRPALRMPAAQPDAPAPVVAAAPAVGRCAAGRSRGLTRAAAAGRACPMLVLHRRQEGAGLAASDPATLPARAQPASRLPPLWHGVELAVPPRAAGRAENRSASRLRQATARAGRPTGRRRRGGRLLARPLRPRVRDRGRLEPGLHLTDRRRRGRDLLDRRRSPRQKTGQEPFRPGHWDVRHGLACLARNPLQEAHALLLAAGAAPCWRAISAR